MSKVIIYTNPDGSVSVVHPTGEVPLDVVLKKDVPAQAITPEVIDKATVPSDRYFRNAWKQQAKVIDIDMAKACDIQMNKIRKMRNKELERLDVEFTKKLGQKKSAEADIIENQRQALRDLPQTFDLTIAKNSDELKALWPNGLPKDE